MKAPLQTLLKEIKSKAKERLDLIRTGKSKKQDPERQRYLCENILKEVDMFRSDFQARSWIRKQDNLANFLHIVHTNNLEEYEKYIKKLMSI